MPETRECEASYIVVSDGLTSIIEKHGPLALEKLQIDAAEKEQLRFPKGHPASQGLPYTIDSKCTVKRGTNRAQSYIYPEMWRTPGKQQCTNLIPTLALRGISYTHRSLILDFGALYFMMQYMTHTSAQLFSRLGWENTIEITDKKVRKFKVGLAFVFKEYVLAFLSFDLVLQPTWRRLRSELPPPPADFCSPDWPFIPALVLWMQKRQNSARRGLACDVIRDANQVFLGIGVYTVNELFLLAGLSLLLSEEEVFSNPSRTARFCAAYLQYLHRSKTGLRSLLSPAMKDGFLAPTKNQRLKYIDWLYVYAKDRARLPARMATLVDEYIVKLDDLSALPQFIRCEETTLYDVFEPTLVSTALSLEHNLGHLIFGDALWAQLGGVVSPGTDQLTLFFQKQCASEPTFLKPDHYSPLFLEKSQIQSQSLPRRITHTYTWDKQMWSITPFPQNSQGVRSGVDEASPRQIEGEERRHMLFSYIVEKTHRVAIGPLEYCGNAHRVSFGASTVVVPCYGDPTLPEFYAIRDLKSRALPPAAPGARRRGMDATASKELEFQLGGLAKSRERKRAREGADECAEPAITAPPKPKKQRLSADRRLALASVNINT